ncbi:MAG: 3-phosphoshikimate 1-carboxyvinyltransferase [Coriobacteriaceae bacterium]|nr:3-phosphoshikimate 1-carboxyvinyltransferase [Coriobacteriaceae bacterium]
MIATITPAPLAGSVPAIASKSMAHRLIIAAALANGETHVVCNTTCDDIDATLRCLTALGARIEAVEDGYRVHPIPKSTSLGILRALAGAELDCGESGSTLRFMLPVACALGAEARFTGRGRLGERPLEPLASELIAAGCELEGAGGLPLTAHGRLRAGRFTLPGNVSSQYITGLMLAAPLLDGPSEILVSGRIESRPYVNLTIQALASFGVRVEQERGMSEGEEATLFRIEGAYRTGGEVTVEGDWSNAAFWLCAGALGERPVSVEGVSLSSAQGDRTILAVLSRFGARVGRSTSAARVQPDRLHAFDMSAQDIPDLVPVISAVASVAAGTTRISDCGRLRLKESDRLETVAAGLANLGARVEIRRDDLIIEGVDTLSSGTVDAAGDHRIAMMAAVAAIRADGPVRIVGAEAVDKSYPAFFDHYRLLGGSVDLSDQE